MHGTIAGHPLVPGTATHVPLRCINADGVPVADYRVEEYATWPARSAPAIIVSADGDVLHGHHRIAAARRRGDSHILAVVTGRGA